MWKVRFLFCCLNSHVFILKRHITALSNKQALEISSQCEVMDANCWEVFVKATVAFFPLDCAYSNQIKLQCKACLRRCWWEVFWKWGFMWEQHHGRISLGAEQHHGGSQWQQNSVMGGSHWDRTASWEDLIGTEEHHGRSHWEQR